MLATSGIAASAAIKALAGPSPLQAGYRAWEDGGGLPSGHVVWAVTAVGFVAETSWADGRRALAAGLAGFVLAVGPLRVSSGAHFGADVLSGYGFGAGWLGVVLWLGRWGPGADQRVAARDRSALR